jgi:hypothetical protein
MGTGLGTRNYLGTELCFREHGFSINQYRFLYETKIVPITIRLLIKAIKLAQLSPHNELASVNIASQLDSPGGNSVFGNITGFIISHKWVLYAAYI